MNPTTQDICAIIKSLPVGHTLWYRVVNGRGSGHHVVKVDESSVLDTHIDTGYKVPWLVDTIEITVLMEYCIPAPRRAPLFYKNAATPTVVKEKREVGCTCAKRDCRTCTPTFL